MPNICKKILIPCVLAILVVTSGCSYMAAKDSVSHSPTNISTDPTCAYYYFLVGSQAEYEQNLDVALAMFKKAIACDPAADYINEKIPILLIRLGKIKEAEKWLKKYIATHPDKNSQRILLADIEIHNGNIPAAIRLYQEARIHDPKNETLFLRLGLLYSQQKNYKKAEEILASLLKKNPKSYFANLYLARVSDKSGDYEKAVHYYKTALALNWSKELVFEMADFYSQYKEYDKALLLYRSILVKNKKDEQASLGLIQTYLSLNKEKEVFKELARLRTFAKDPAKIDLIESRIYLNLGKPKKAEKLLLSLMKRKKSDQAQYLLAVTYYNEKKLDKSLQTLKSIDPLSDEFEDGLFLQLRILRDTKQIDDALALLEKTIADKSLRKPIYYLLLSSLYQEKPDAARALDVLKEAEGLYPNNDQVFFDLAILLEKMGKHNQAMSAMEKVLQLKPNHPEALNFIGYTWADANIHLKKALSYIKRAIAQKPNNGYIRDSLGWVYFRMGDYDRAVEELQKAVSKEPNDPHILEHLGDAYMAKGLKNKALDTYIKALHFATKEKDKENLQKKIKASKTY